jgi:exosortase
MTNSTRRPQATIWFLCYAAACTLVFIAPLRKLLQVALGSDTYTHILIIPAISIVLLWMEWKAAPQTSGRSTVLAAGVFIAGVLLGGIGWWTQSVSTSVDWLDLSILGFLCMIWAGFLFFYGAKTFRAELFPLLFLLLMVPIPGFLLDHLIWWLQLGSAEVADWVFRLSGTPVLREGLIFALPGVTIEVAKECSGIRSTEALLITCLLAGHMFLRTNWRRGVLLVAALPVLVIKNGIRIAVLSLLAVRVDRSFLTGNLHREGGFLFFILGMVILVPLLWWLRKSEAKSFRASKGPLKET